ncbi:MAG: inner membrane-spanning protein YciB [Bdellovibrionota bacterium]
MNQRAAGIRNFLLGGLAPIVAFAVVEEIYGTIGGVIAGIVFGGGEILWEYRRFGKVQGITWLSNALVLVLGLLSIWENNGVFFKLQPAIFMVVFAGIFLGSSALNRPFLVETAKKQNPNIPPEILVRFKGVNTRLGFVFIALAVLCVYSAVYWSTAAWATLKGVGLPVLTSAYMLIEIVIIRFRNRRPGAGGA